MNNLSFKLKKVLQNRNTVTIIGVLLVLVLLYFGYNSQVEDAVTPIDVPVAAEHIQPRTLITSQMITTLSVPNIAVSEDVILSSSLIIGKYTTVNAFIPKGSMFFNSTVVERSQLPDYGISQIKEGERPVYFKVDVDSTYGNSILPDSYVDIYVRGESDGKPFIARLIENVKIIAVKDSSGNNVFENTSENRTPDSILFGLEAESEDNPFMLLLRATYIQDVEIFMVPHGTLVPTDVETTLSSEALIEFIKAQTIDLDSKDETQIEIENGDGDEEEEEE